MATKDNIEKLIVENEKIAYDLAWQFNKKLNGIIELDDLVGLAKLGLVKAANTFNMSKNFKFTTYAYKVISNEILMQLRKENKHKNVYSYDKLISNVDNNKTYEEILKIDYDFEETIIKQNLLRQLDIFINDLEPVARKIIKLYLLDYSQDDIAKIVGVSQATISRNLKSIIYKLRYKFNVGKEEI